MPAVLGSFGQIVPKDFSRILPSTYIKYRAEVQALSKIIKRGLIMNKKEIQRIRQSETYKNACRRVVFFTPYNF